MMHAMRVIGWMTSKMDKVLKFGLTGQNTLGNTEMEISMAMANSSGTTAAPTMESSRTTRSMGTEHTSGLTLGNT